MTTAPANQTDLAEGGVGTRLMHFPELDPALKPIDAPVRQVTLLEDRAQVRRVGRAELVSGRSRLLIRDVAPVLQDVSLRATAAGPAGTDPPAVRVVDVRARRAMRVRAADKPERARALETEIEALVRRYQEVGEDRERAEQRYAALLDILGKGVTEIPEDAGWGLVNHQVWHDTFQTLYRRARSLVEKTLECYATQQDLGEQAVRLAAERRAFDRWDTDFVAWIELDVEARQAGSAELVVEYVVPNAIWRPLHSARLGADHRVHVRSCAAVWQNTGEDWRDVQLVFSTARSSLGTEPPLLEDDVLQAQRKSERVVVEQRQVMVQQAGLGREGGAAAVAPQAVDLPGVDDGGEVQNLRAGDPSTLPSDGRPTLVPLFDFEAAADCRLLTAPELDPKVFLKATLANGSRHPLLAGPVELVRASGTVGWTRLLFVAPGEKFELSFGHDDALRVYRSIKHETRVDEVEKWTHNDNSITVFLSNLSGSEKLLEVRERIPVAEIEHVRVKVIEEKCQPAAPAVDKDGFCTWSVTLPPHGHATLRLAWRLSTAPGVEGI